ncbi:MAG TPA: HupE/UreJ family protein [Casimicrobiaceae bacterium]
MRRHSALVAGAIALGALVSQTADAHLLGAHGGVLAGFTHPFLGLDHVLAMLAVGLWAAQMGGRALWAVPLTFIATLAGGAWLGNAGVTLPAVEAGIAASVLVFGLLVALAVRFPLAVGMLLTGAFALFHGHAHGTELPAMASPLAYAGGFVVATGLLHLTGVALASAFHARSLRVAGACVAAAGALIVAGL